jgi:hypothetical protein
MHLAASQERKERFLAREAVKMREQIGAERLKKQEEKAVVRVRSCTL